MDVRRATWESPVDVIETRYECKIMIALPGVAPVPVSPVGGIKEKVIAARAGVKTVMLPARNQRDLEDMPETIRNRLRFIGLEKVDDILAVAIRN